MDLHINAPVALVSAAVMLVFSMRRYLARQLGQEAALQYARTACRVRRSRPLDLPDIYYIILDGYARQMLPSAYYGSDNSDFTNYFEVTRVLYCRVERKQLSDRP